MTDSLFVKEAEPHPVHTVLPSEMAMLSPAARNVLDRFRQGTYEVALGALAECLLEPLAEEGEPGQTRRTSTPGSLSSER